MIGIFWVYKNTVFGKAISIERGERGAFGMVDSPDDHNDLWDREKVYIRIFPGLCQFDYFDIPRGRVLYSTNDQKTNVYMDKTLFDARTKRRIADFFQLDIKNISWRTDFHYTTASPDLERLFEQS